MKPQPPPKHTTEQPLIPSTERSRISRAAQEWLAQRQGVLTPFNIITALDVLRYLRETTHCTWQEDEHRNHETSCGQITGNNDADEVRQHVKFCYNCGKPVKFERYVEDWS